MTETITVTRDQYAVGHGAAQLLDKLLSGADAKTIEDAIAKVNPTAKFPGREAREALSGPILSQLEQERKAREALEARLKEREDAEAKAKEDHQVEELRGRLDKIKKSRGFSDEAMEKVLQRMRDNNNPDVDAAAAWVAETLPKPAPATATPGFDYLGGNVDVYGSHTQDEAWKGLHENPDRWLTNELRTIAHDPEFARLGNAA